MQANQFWQQRNAPQGNTEATRKPSPQDIRRATGNAAVDYHVERATEKE